MGNSFNKILYTVLAVIFIALLLVKFFFKRSIPISKLSMNKRKLEKLSAGNAIPINIKERQFSNSKNIILKKRMTIKRAKKEVDFTTKGSKYSFTGEIKGKSLIVENQNTGNRSEFTGSLMVKLKSKGQLERVLKEYNLKLIKER